MRGAAVLLPAAAAAAQPTVTLDGGGSLAGVAADGVDQYLGVPYAEPPTGDAGRWRAPAEKKPWTGSRDASSFGATCSGAGPGCPTPSEDCLFLNVYAPSARAAGAQLPVMLWIHGGGYMTGCSNVYSAASLVNASNGEVVVVTVNYRLNVFGFLGAAELKARSPEGSVGNYGIQDQRMAMQWVKENIAAFGGDPGAVTIFGESAGAGSVATHLVAKKSFGLYQRAAAESGATANWDCNTLDKAQALYTNLMKDVKCDDVDCLVALDTKTIAASNTVATASGFAGLKPGKDAQALPFAPVVDGVELTEEVWQMFRDGDVNAAVPVLLGANRDEFALFMGEVLNRMTKLEFEAYTEAYGVANGAKIRAVYDPDNNGTYPYPTELGKKSAYWWAAMRSTTDAAFVCPARRAARWLEQRGAPAVYLYMFAHPTAGRATVPHASEIGYVFNCPLTASAGIGSCAFQKPEEAALSEAMASYWINFAKTGDPNGVSRSGDGLPAWPKYTVKSRDAAGYDAEQRLDVAPAGVRTETALRSHACDVHDAILLD